MKKYLFNYTIILVQYTRLILYFFIIFLHELQGRTFSMQVSRTKSIVALDINFLGHFEIQSCSA